jgi:tRNA pseudouridine55 synthase
VGHAGTLDPLATGVMIICVGAFTKKIEQYQAQEKEYTGTFTLGATTPSFDLEKPVDETFPINHITEEKIHKVAQSFLGVQ